MSLTTPDAFCSHTYDYVIAGGGTAGLTLAARLTEDPKVSVAVIEAGEDHSGDLTVLVNGLTSGKSNYSLNNLETKLSHCFGMVDDDDRVIAWPRGRQLGGSSAINLEFWNRASAADINDWGELGNDGWSWEELFPYFLKTETFVPPSKDQIDGLDIPPLNSSSHGDKGPIQVSYPGSFGPLQKAWDPTFDTLGLGIDGDPFDGQAIGGFTTPISQDPKNISRSYAATAYYNPVKGRPNLKLLTDALVTKVKFADRGCDQNAPLMATGVTFTTKGKSYEVHASKEVVLSAGVVQSPQLLELSGIGSGDLLKSLSIDVLIDNPNVGENLQDHQQTSLGFEVADGVTTLDSFSKPGFVEQAIADYLSNRTGPLTNASCSTSFLSYQQLLDISKTKSTLPTADEAYQPSEDALKKNPGLAKQYELITRKLKDPHEASTQQLFIPAGISYQNASNSSLLFRSPGPGSFCTFYGLAIHPYSRGSIHINSSDPAKYPVIDPRYLSNPLDLDVLSTIAFSLQTLATTPPFSSLLKDNGSVYEIGFERITSDNVRDHVRRTLNSLYHAIGTCSMEPRDKGGVVDARLKVYGTQNLRVVDASVAPMLTRGTIQSFVYAIAEKAADMIKEDAAKG
ncbi:MAG: hypothetical protein M4579_005182 [Chaenotheca gracillima]|nr:MAG: hypothetical protein M4579_005182 [Chaenotheca gracillima]